MLLNGKKLLAVIAFLFLSSCRNDPPPTISVICILDGVGGGDCVKADGTKVYMLPSEMVNMWATTQADEQSFAQWCYKTSARTVEYQMNMIKEYAK